MLMIVIPVKIVIQAEIMLVVVNASKSEQEEALG